MQAYQLLARLRFLTLAGQNEDGELEFIGTYQHWNQAANYERQYENT